MADEREREHFVDSEPQVLEGEDEVPRQPAPPVDPYTPEPGPAPGERRAFRAMWLAWAIVAILVVTIVAYAVVR
ncbi:MAG: hypothetical protein ABR583_13790 [Gaiellaceae bacterium]